MAYSVGVGGQHLYNAAKNIVSPGHRQQYQQQQYQPSSYSLMSSGSGSSNGSNISDKENNYSHAQQYASHVNRQHQLLGNGSYQQQQQQHQQQQQQMHFAQQQQGLHQPSHQYQYATSPQPLAADTQLLWHKSPSPQPPPQPVNSPYAQQRQPYMLQQQSQQSQQPQQSPYDLYSTPPPAYNSHDFYHSAQGSEPAYSPQMVHAPTDNTGAKDDYVHHESATAGNIAFSNTSIITAASSALLPVTPAPNDILTDKIRTLKRQLDAGDQAAVKQLQALRKQLYQDILTSITNQPEVVDVNYIIDTYPRIASDYQQSRASRKAQIQSLQKPSQDSELPHLQRSVSTPRVVTTPEHYLRTLKSKGTSPHRLGSSGGASNLSPTHQLSTSSPSMRPINAAPRSLMQLDQHQLSSNVAPSHQYMYNGPTPRANPNRISPRDHTVPNQHSLPAGPSLAITPRAQSVPWYQHSDAMHAQFDSAPPSHLLYGDSQPQQRPQGLLASSGYSFSQQQQQQQQQQQPQYSQREPQRSAQSNQSRAPTQSQPVPHSAQSHRSSGNRGRKLIVSPTAQQQIQQQLLRNSQAAQQHAAPSLMHRTFSEPDMQHQQQPYQQPQVHSLRSRNSAEDHSVLSPLRNESSMRHRMLSINTQATPLQPGFTSPKTAQPAIGYSNAVEHHELERRRRMSGNYRQTLNEPHSGYHTTAGAVPTRIPAFNKEVYQRKLELMSPTSAAHAAAYDYAYDTARQEFEPMSAVAYSDVQRSMSRASSSYRPSALQTHRPSVQTGVTKQRPHSVMISHSHRNYNEPHSASVLPSQQHLRSQSAAVSQSRLRRLKSPQNAIASSQNNQSLGSWKNTRAQEQQQNLSSSSPQSGSAPHRTRTLARQHSDMSGVNSVGNEFGNISLDQLDGMELQSPHTASHRSSRGRKDSAIKSLRSTGYHWSGKLRTMSTNTGDSSDALNRSTGSSSQTYNPTASEYNKMSASAYLQPTTPTAARPVSPMEIAEQIVTQTNSTRHLSAAPVRIMRISEIDDPAESP